MAPTKSQSTMLNNKVITKSILSMSRRAISTRSQNKQNVLVDSQNEAPMGKRKADASPPRNEKGIKRSALGNVTNALLNANDDNTKITRSKCEAKKSTISPNGKKNQNQIQFVAPTAIQRQAKVVTRSTAARGEGMQFINSKTVIKKVNTTNVVVKGKKKTEINVVNNNFKTIDTEYHKNDTKTSIHRLSNEFETTENESHYLSALEDLTTSSIRLSVDDLRQKSISSDGIDSTFSLVTIGEHCQSTDMTVTSSQFEATIKNETIQTTGPMPVPEGVIDFDRENWDDPVQASNYAMDIFNYLKEREELFKIDAYMERQPHLNNWMRTLLVDWMVEVQETFELNHETLYLAVKIVDIYLSKITIEKEKLQLIGAAALFLSCKFDERKPPLIDDFLYICDGAYKHQELVRMEMDEFRTIGFDLGIPLSYRFLRRYARCAKVTMPELTLARFILEFSLMNYELVSASDSKLAAACLFMALRMNKKTGWNKTLEYYSGYKVNDFKSLIPQLNGPLYSKQRDANKTIRNKYTHKVFFEVSKVPLLTNEQLLECSDQIETL